MSPITKGLKIVSKWILLDSLAYIRESWRQPDFPERKESWSPQDVTLPSIMRNFILTFLCPYLD